ncbi:hypothetical protein [Planctomyces sp. SH-PL62]|uniref:hypothetical protein n=1 Tax=Planctomyces sp. SH-PL62 TaxID=1636152 RepID=UPI00078D9475|nr:hypothetical protein [Planctomyces sp. SH-PL62]AMV38196.1 hypothetical protein VT85_12215 [Planctomyces sp. SH-PL62]
MHAQRHRKRLTAAGLSLLAAAALAAPRAASADDSGLFGRLFRLGGASNSARSKPAPAPRGDAEARPGAPDANGAGRNSNPGPKHDHDHGANAFVPPAAPRGPAPTPTTGPIGEGPSTPEVAGGGPAAPRSPPGRGSATPRPTPTRS